jgi:hypothetical protein
MPMAVQEPVDRGRMHAMAEACFQRGFDGRESGQLAGPRLWNQGRQQGAFFCEWQVGPLTLPPARGVHGCRPLAVIGSQEIMDGLFGHADMTCDDTGGGGINQGMPNNPPTADTPERLGVFEHDVNLCFRPMRGGFGHPWHGARPIGCQRVGRE